MRNPEQTIISQYFDSTTIQTIVNYMNQWKGPEADIELLYDGVWNLDTAVGYGLDRWGRIVGVGRVVQTVAGGPYFGFAEAQDPNAISGFGWGGPLFAGGPTTGNNTLDDAGFRTLILAKAAANISDGSAASINSILNTLFGASGKCYVVDGLNMTITYTFEFWLDKLQAAIFYQSGIIPRPAGVQAILKQGP
jgi:hypothetical protein